jgi:hypothetical protein
MKTRALSFARVGAILVLLLTLALSGDPPGPAQARTDRAPAPVASNPNPSPIFIQNAGQFPDGARFQVRGGDRTVWLAEDAIWLTLMEAPADDARSHLNRRPAGSDAVDRARNGANVKLSFVDANPRPRLEPFNRLDTVVSYFIGSDPARWRSAVPVWGGVRYVDLYPGIDLELTGEQGQLVLRLVAGSGADLSAVRLRVEGAGAVTVPPGGDALRLSTSAGDAVWPLLRTEGVAGEAAAQPAGALAFEVAAPFAPPDGNPVAQAGPSGTNDWQDLLYGTYLGGSDYEEGFDIAVDGNGATYVTGTTGSSDFPIRPGAFDASYGGSDDAFVAKLNTLGSALDYATFLGGSSGDLGHSIAVDPGGQASVTGYTNSSDFPTSQGAFDRTHNGGDAFVVKLGSNGSALVYSTFLGGSLYDEGYDIAVDSSGAAYVTGATESFDFPTTSGAFDTAYNGGDTDAFVVELNRNGSALVFGAFLGGSDYDVGYGIALGPNWEAFVTGNTRSPDFPFTSGAFDKTYNGGDRYGDAFVVRLGSDGRSLFWGTFLGGSNSDVGYGISVNWDYQACITGETSSSDFPTTAGAFDTNYHGGDSDAFVAKLDWIGHLVYATFLGGAGAEYGRGIAVDWSVDGSGEAVVTGATDSLDFPITLGAFYTVYHGGDSDAFVARLDGAGSTLAYSTFLGGSSTDRGYCIAVDVGGAAYVTGQTSSVTTPTSEGFPTTPGAFANNNSGSYDAFVVKLAAGGSDELLQKLKLLFVPLEWKNTQTAFDTEAQTQVNLFLDQVPLNGCRDQVVVETLLVADGQNLSTFACGSDKGNEPVKGTDAIRGFVSDTLKIDPTQWDVIVGLAETSPCDDTRVQGESNKRDTIWVTSLYDMATAHELGHIFGLADQYCSNQAGSQDSRCNDGDSQGDGAASGDFNWLDASLPYDCPPDGSNDSGGLRCCNFSITCKTEGGCKLEGVLLAEKDKSYELRCHPHPGGEYGVLYVDYGGCCRGNKNAAGGRSTMSYAEAPGPRGFDGRELAHLQTRPDLICESGAGMAPHATAYAAASGAQPIVDVSLLLYRNDSVTDDSISVTFGRPTMASALADLAGDYTLRVVDATGNTSWSQAFPIYFDYWGPMLEGETYSDIVYDAEHVSFRIPFAFGMSTVELYHGGTLIYSRGLRETGEGTKLYLPLVLRND